MQLIYFTKFLKGLSPEQIAETATTLGVDGLDLAIRAGQCVNPSNIREALPKAMAVWRKSNVVVPLATLEGGAIDPSRSEIETIFAACAEQGIANIKLGYWLWKETDWPGARMKYWKAVDLIRVALGRFEILSEKYGIRSLVHTHCDNYYAVNASAARHLVSGFDSRHVGLYLDPAHLSLNGEILPMAIDICGEYLHMIAAKSVRWKLSSETAPGKPAEWKHDWCGLSEGLINWPAALRSLHAAGYAGPISVHGEYSGPEITADILKRVSADVAFLRAHAVAPPVHSMAQGV